MLRASRLLVVSGSTIALWAGLTGSAPTLAAQGKGAEVIHDLFGCVFEPGDVPGVNVFFDAQCLQVRTPSGNGLIVAKGRLPAGITLARSFQGTLPCTFFGTRVLGHISATKSGVVRATCHFTNV